MLKAEEKGWEINKTLSYYYYSTWGALNLALDFLEIKAQMGNSTTYIILLWWKESMLVHEENGFIVSWSWILGGICCPCTKSLEPTHDRFNDVSAEAVQLFMAPSQETRVKNNPSW